MQAAEILADLGIRIRPEIIGITSTPTKRKALEGLGARVFETTDEAVELSLKEIKSDERIRK
jgi:hypothetical protein